MGILLHVHGCAPAVHLALLHHQGDRDDHGIRDEDSFSTVLEVTSPPASSSLSEITNFQIARANQKTEMAKVPSSSSSPSFDEPETMSSETLSLPD